MKPPPWSAATGSIDWLCWPHFASPACFAALLGTPKTTAIGRLRRRRGRASRRRYLAHTLVLETTFETNDGSATLVDFMPPAGHQSQTSSALFAGVHGSVAMEMELVLRFDYGRSVPWVTSMEDGALRAIAGPDMAVLRTPASLRGENLRTCGEFTVHRRRIGPVRPDLRAFIRRCPVRSTRKITAVHPGLLARSGRAMRICTANTPPSWSAR